MNKRTYHDVRRILEGADEVDETEFKTIDTLLRSLTK